VIDNRKAFQLYLLGQMRGGLSVERALATLRASRADVEDASRFMVQRGFEQPSVTMSAYEALLGPPVDRGECEDGDPYDQAWTSYLFDVWPKVRLVVFGSRTGVAAGLRFERHPHEPVSPMVDLQGLEPWRTTYADLETSGWPMVTRETWYPVTDAEIQLPDTLDRFLLQFDFWLLQAVHPVEG
jgi:hypothetical protein